MGGFQIPRDVQLNTWRQFQLSCPHLLRLQEAFACCPSKPAVGEGLVQTVLCDRAQRGQSPTSDPTEALTLGAGGGTKVPGRLLLPETLTLALQILWQIPSAIPDLLLHPCFFWSCAANAVRYSYTSRVTWGTGELCQLQDCRYNQDTARGSHPAPCATVRPPGYSTVPLLQTIPGMLEQRNLEI